MKEFQAQQWCSVSIRNRDTGYGYMLICTQFLAEIKAGILAEPQLVFHAFCQMHGQSLSFRRLKGLVPYQKHFLFLYCYLAQSCLTAHTLEVQLRDLATYWNVIMAVLCWEKQSRKTSLVTLWIIMVLPLQTRGMYSRENCKQALFFQT